MSGDMVAWLGLLVAFLVALGSAVGFFIKRLDRYVSREEQNVALQLIATQVGTVMHRIDDQGKRLDKLHDSIHDVRQLAQKILIEGVKLARVEKGAD